MIFIELLKVFILGIVEGLTEWLPISSTGHMLLVDEFLQLDMSNAFKEMFFVVIQLGAILAVVVIFWSKMFPFSYGEKSLIKKNTLSIWIKVIVACIPSAIIGIFFEDSLEAYYGSPTIISVMLVFYGVLFIVIERWNKKRKASVNKISDISYKIAFMIGVFQVLAFIPGTSRSGATIIGALIIGVSRVAATEFSFFLAVPTMVGASALKLFKFGLNFTGSEIFVLVFGMVISYIVSILAIKFLMGYIKKNDFRVFGWYRIILGFILLLYFDT